VVLPGPLMLSLVIKPAARQHEGINTFTKEPMIYKAKPARKVVRIRALVALTDAVRGPAIRRRLFVGTQPCRRTGRGRR
jgi:hypothetical protein